ncbi:MAG: polysaccharide biosynthesis tyrosine autokinase [Phycisphaerae bacterium]
MEYRAHLPTGNGTAKGTELFLPNGPYPIQQKRVEHTHAAPTLRRVRPSSLLHYKWFALTVFLIIAVPGAFIGWFTHEPAFEAFGKIEVTPIEQKLADDSGRQSAMPFYKQAMATLADNIRDPEVLARVLDQPEVKETQWFKRKPTSIFGFTPSNLDRLRNQLKVRPQNDANFIRVSFECNSADDAKTIIQSVLDEFQFWYGSQKGERQKNLQDRRSEKIATLRNELDLIRTKVNDIRRRLKTDNASQLLSEQRIAQEKIKAELAAAELELKALETAKAAFDEKNSVEQSDEDAPTTIANENYYLQDRTWLDFHAALRRAEDQLALNRDRYGPKSRQLLQLESDVSRAKDQLKGREEQIDKLVMSNMFGTGKSNDTGMPGILDLDQRMQIVQATIKQLNTNLAKQETVVLATLSDVNELEEYERQKGAKKQYYDELVSTETKESIEGGRPGMIQHVSEKAYAPSEPSNEKRRYLMIALAIFGAAAVSVALTFARLLMNPQVSETGDLIDTTQSPILGFVPLLVDAKDMNPEAIATQAEHFRMVRTSLLERIQSDVGVSLLITSAGPGAGKTTVTEHLGRSFTQCGKRVLLVDGDLRRQSLASRMNIRKEPGLLELLQGFASESDVIVRGEVGEPDVVTAGRLDSVVNSELLASRQFKDLIESWRPRYDIILVDGPPLLPIADARIIANSTDAAILIVREGHCRRGEVSFAVSTLTNAARKFLGTIFLGSPRSSGYPGYYSSYYGYDYGATSITRAEKSDVTTGKRS